MRSLDMSSYRGPPLFFPRGFVPQARDFVGDPVPRVCDGGRACLEGFTRLRVAFLRAFILPVPLFIQPSCAYLPATTSDRLLN